MEIIILLFDKNIQTVHYCNKMIMTGNKAMFITGFLGVRLTDDRIDSVQGGRGITV